MKVIALFGRAECGKSETLGIHLRKLVHDKAGVVYDPGVWKDTRESISHGDKVIDICPSGDTESIVLKNVEFFDEHPFDVAFCATRSWGKGRRALEQYVARIGADLVWIKKPYNDDLDAREQLVANQKLAKELFDKYL